MEAQTGEVTCLEPHCDYSTTELHPRSKLIFYNNYMAGWIRVVSCQFVHPNTGP